MSFERGTNAVTIKCLRSRSIDYRRVWTKHLRTWLQAGFSIRSLWNNLIQPHLNQIRLSLQLSLSEAWNWKPSSISCNRLAILIAIKLFWNSIFEVPWWYGSNVFRTSPYICYLMIFKILGSIAISVSVVRVPMHKIYCKLSCIMNRKCPCIKGTAKQDWREQELANQAEKLKAHTFICGEIRLSSLLSLFLFSTCIKINIKWNGPMALFSTCTTATSHNFLMRHDYMKLSSLSLSINTHETSSFWAISLFFAVITLMI